jgi:hypothetical protein
MMMDIGLTFIAMCLLSDAKWRNTHKIKTASQRLNKLRNRQQQTGICKYLIRFYVDHYEQQSQSYPALLLFSFFFSFKSSAPALFFSYSPHLLPSAILTSFFLAASTAANFIFLSAI